ncbi:MAG: hypothetical protein A2826_02005 [Candidatus Doudnabacteria bacterium RIFCSPHIGHO2_01_FULL_43_23]|uniref:Ubiquinone biosynthesis protein UbiA n=1 Tax=Candidatus Doudnabacteria bacterium RIFCSPHIGHO2_01_FULL_43_23 TaxID=1817822 RepID=A0A1F5NUG8_9BACT|nr:MAG: hypothetical protein A2826_02005 [Candidatus Doudnabacteria bacterium RIFCSPHIGHO2_01_FULL_43_23]
MRWIMALRPSSGVATALLVASGFRHGNLAINWTVVVSVFLMTYLAMVWNDYHDRDADIAKGRFLASSHPVYFRNMAFFLSIASITMSLRVMWQNQAFGFLCLAIWSACMFYPFAKTNALAKNMIVSLTMASTVTFPLLEGVHAPMLWLMAIITTITVSVREHTKDIEDVEVDRGRKKTFALALKKNLSKNEAVRLRTWTNIILVWMMI